MRTLLGLLVLVACRAPADPTSPVPVGSIPLPWTLGAWRGTRTDAASGDVAPMRLVARPVLGGAGELQELEVETTTGVYRGLHLVLHDTKRDLWVSHYSNAPGGRSTPLEGSPSATGFVWRNASPERTHESRLLDERVGSGRWCRTQEVSEDGGASWHVRFIDALERADEASEPLDFEEADVRIE